jgi:AraC-like DNA-binding protein
MQKRAESPDPETYCLRQLRRFLACAETGRLALHLPKPAGLWLRIQGSHFHTSPELFLQPSGRTQFRFPSGKFLLRTGHVCLLPSGLPHEDCPCVPYAAFRHMVLVMRSPREISVHLTQRHKTGGRRHAIVFSRIIQGATAVSVANYLDDLLAAAHGRYWKPRTNGLLTALFAAILESWTSSVMVSTRENIKISQCKQLLSTRLGDPNLSVTSIARQIECSPDYLSGLFRKECGVSLIAYVNHARVDQALFLLRHTTMSIKEIAAACGFSRPSYFIHVFRRLQGTSPLQYRAALRGDDRSAPDQAKTCRAQASKRLSVSPIFSHSWPLM